MNIRDKKRGSLGRHSRRALHRRLSFAVKDPIRKVNRLVSGVH